MKRRPTSDELKKARLNGVNACYAIADHINTVADRYREFVRSVEGDGDVLLALGVGMSLRKALDDVVDEYAKSIDEVGSERDPEPDPDDEYFDGDCSPGGQLQ